MSELKKKCLVVMLPTKNDNPVEVPFLRMNQKNQLVRHCAGGEFRKYTSLGFKPQHLYICSQEEIKEGDWVITQAGHLRQCTDKRPQGDKWICLSTNNLVLTSHCMKVITTTDSSLKVFKTLVGDNKGHHFNTFLPTVSESFIQKYIEQYNKGQQIKECMVEYEDVFNDFANEGFKGIKLPEIWKPKLRNNEIIITKCKDSWSREEVVVLLNKAIWDHIGHNEEAHEQKDIDQWLEENL